MPIDTQNPDEAPVEVMPGVGLPKTPFNIGRKKETRIYYKPHNLVTFIEVSSGKELANVPETAKELKRRIALGEVKQKSERIWIPTTPLPADAWHMMYYARKGFKLWPPGEEPGQEYEHQTPEDVSLTAKKKGKVLNISCPVEGCNKIVHSYIGLSRHMSTAHNQK